MPLSSHHSPYLTQGQIAPQTSSQPGDPKRVCLEPHTHFALATFGSRHARVCSFCERPRMRSFGYGMRWSSFSEIVGPDVLAHIPPNLNSTSEMQARDKRHKNMHDWKSSLISIILHLLLCVSLFQLHIINIQGCGKCYVYRLNTLIISKHPQRDQGAYRTRWSRRSKHSLL
jgi:hypothetical protein